MIFRRLQLGEQLKETVPYQVFEPGLFESGVVVLDDAVREELVCELTWVQSMLQVVRPARLRRDLENVVYGESIVKQSRFTFERS